MMSLAAFTTPIQLPRPSSRSRNYDCHNQFSHRIRPPRTTRTVRPLSRSRPHASQQLPSSANKPSLPEAAAVLKCSLDTLNAFSGSPDEARALTVQLINAVTDSFRETTLASSQNNNTKDDDFSITPLYRQLAQSNHLCAFSTSRPPAATPSSQKNTSVERLVSQAGLPISALSPRRSTVVLWQLAGAAVVLSVVQVLRTLGLQQYARPLLLSLAAGYVFDSLALKGMVFERIYQMLFPEYAEKVLAHEAGHFLAAYLHGLPVQGYVLSASEALDAGIPGQAGTLFSDDELFAELRMGKLTNRAIDRYSIVAMAGIAAEAINYGEAEGGESDVAALLRLLTTLQPPWTEGSVRSQARWAVLEAVLLLRRNEGAFIALRDAMRERKSLGECILSIEDNFVAPEVEEVETPNTAKSSSIEERERVIVAELERIRRQVESFPKE